MHGWRPESDGSVAGLGVNTQPVVIRERIGVWPCQPSPHETSDHHEQDRANHELAETLRKNWATEPQQVFEVVSRGNCKLCSDTPNEGPHQNCVLEAAELPKCLSVVLVPEDHRIPNGLTRRAQTAYQTVRTGTIIAIVSTNLTVNDIAYSLEEYACASVLRQLFHRQV
jgi:hypothetical protein